VALLFTTLHYYYSGLSLEQFDEAFKRLLRNGSCVLFVTSVCESTTLFGVQLFLLRCATVVPQLLDELGASERSTGTGGITAALADNEANLARWSKGYTSSYHWPVRELLHICFVTVF